MLSERHPEKQGLKPGIPRIFFSFGGLSERHPEKQGLKHNPVLCPNACRRLSERHPEKQGLKQEEGGGFITMFWFFQSVIQKNKD